MADFKLDIAFAAVVLGLLGGMSIVVLAVLKLGA